MRNRGLEEGQQPGLRPNFVHIIHFNKFIDTNKKLLSGRLCLVYDKGNVDKDSM
jgi:hypothetical protein